MEFRRRRRIDATIDMTPMIDTLLQLFVVFLLSMSFVASAVRLDLPHAAVRQTTAESPVAVSIDANNAWFVNNTPVTKDELATCLQAHFVQGKRREVLLRADRSLTYDRILDAIVVIQRSGTTNILLAYDQDGD